MSSISFEVFRGDQHGQLFRETVTRDLQPNEIFNGITHSGLCGTDDHFLSSNIALGYEGVGVVKQLGSNVSGFEVGDRVGFGICSPSLRFLQSLHEW
jgi:D-arabinose 1-dehydrogenase-like Zn-dependent alcohol dehydrogenase